MSTYRPIHPMGEQTRIARKDIAFFYCNIDKVNVHEQFLAGIIKAILNIGYKGEVYNTWDIIDFICEKFKEHKIMIKKNQNDNTRSTIERWLSDTGSPPNDSEQSRHNVYKLCFALEMNAFQTEEFFLKHYLCRSFNFKDYKECVYYFCMNTERKYSDAKRLIEKVEALTPEKHNKIQETKAIGDCLLKIKDEDSFIKVMPNFLYVESEQRKTVNERILKLEKECRKIAGIDQYEKKSLLRAIYYDDKHINPIGNKNLNRSNGLDEKKAPYISTNFPLETTLSNIKNKKQTTNDRCRRVLVLLHFYKFYGHLYNLKINSGIHYSEVDLSDKYDQFEISLNTLLIECGFVELYIRNPYDAFFLSFAKRKDPLREFRKTIYNLRKNLYE